MKSRKSDELFKPVKMTWLEFLIDNLNDVFFTYGAFLSMGFACIVIGIAMGELAEMWFGAVLIGVVAPTGVLVWYKHDLCAGTAMTREEVQIMENSDSLEEYDRIVDFVREARTELADARREYEKR